MRKKIRNTHPYNIFGIFAFDKKDPATETLLSNRYDGCYGYFLTDQDHDYHKIVCKYWHESRSKEEYKEMKILGWHIIWTDL